MSADKVKGLKEDMLYYFETPKEYAVNQNLQLFADIIASPKETQLNYHLAIK